MYSTTTFDIQPVAREDIPRLVQMFVFTCMADNAVKLNYNSADECSKRGYTMFESQFSESEFQFYKAVDRETGVIASFVSWKRPTDDQIRARDKKYKASIAEKENIPGKQAATAKIADVLHQHTERVINEWTHNHRHIYFMFLVTDPMFQKRGMGSALSKLVNEDADRCGLPVLLRASPYGWPIYAKLGYKVIEHIDIDLREYVPRGEENEQGFGMYRFRYMIRLPQISAS